MELHYYHLPCGGRLLFLPLDAVKESLLKEKLDARAYFFDSGDYEVLLITPILQYHLEEEGNIKATKEKEKRTRNKQGAIQGTMSPLDDLREWKEYAGEYKPVLIIRARPKVAESFWSGVNRAFAARYSIQAAAKLHFKTDFYRMKLKCGDNEIEPIHPGRKPVVRDIHTGAVNLTDATYEGAYFYPADAITSACGEVTLELYSEKKPESAHVKRLDAKTVKRVEADFEPYLKATIRFSELSPGVGTLPMLLAYGVSVKIAQGRRLCF